MDQKLTIIDIAKMANVSPSTVSRVINGQVGGRSKVKARVLQVIEETGFRPSAVAQTLASNRSGMIGVIFPNSVTSILMQHFYARTLEAITFACNQFDYNLVLFLSQTESDEKKIFEKLSHPNLLDGLIANVGCVNGERLVPLLAQVEVPVILAGHYGELENYSYVAIDNVRAMANVVQHLISLGRKRIATITGPLNVTDGLDRLEGYRQTLQARGYSVDEELIVEGDFTEMTGYYAAKRLIAQNVDAIAAANDATAIGALRAIRDAGLSVPEDIAVTGFDNTADSARTTPPLTTVRQPLSAFGRKLVEQLVEQIENPHGHLNKIVLDTELVIRQSCGENIW